MPVLVDTNVLGALRGASPSDDAYPRPVNMNGFGNWITATDKLTSRIEAFFTVLPDSIEAFRFWRCLVVENEISGAKLHDARLAAIIHSHGIKQILTFNTADFKRFSHVVAVPPAELAT